MPDTLAVQLAVQFQRTCTAMCSCFMRSLLRAPLPLMLAALPQPPTALSRPAVPPLPLNMPLSVMVRPVPGGSCSSLTATLTPCQLALQMHHQGSSNSAHTF